MKIKLVTKITMYLGVLAALPVNARVDLVTLPEISSIEVTPFLQQITGLETIHNVIPINLGNGPDDDFLLIDAGWQILMLDLATGQPAFPFDRQTLGSLFQIPCDGRDNLTAINPQGRQREAGADLLVLITQSGQRYTLDLVTAQTSSYEGEPTLPGDYFSGLSYAAELDYGCMHRQDSTPPAWYYRDFGTGSDVTVDLSSIVGYQPVFIHHLALRSSGIEALLCISEEQAFTPTPAETAQPTPTPTPASTQYPFAAIVINSLGENLSMVGRETPRQITIDAARCGAAPNRMVLHEGEAYVVNSLSNTVTVHDPASGRFVRQYGIGDWSNPWDIVFIDSERFAISCLISNKIKVFHRINGFETEVELPENLPKDPEIDVTWPRPMGMTMHQGLVYVACGNLSREWVAGGPGIVCVVNPATSSVERWFEIPGRNTGAVVCNPELPDLLFCINSGDADPTQHQFVGNGTIVAFSLATQSPAYTIPTGGAPVWLVFAGNGKGYASNAYDSSIIVIDPTTGSVLPSISLPVSGSTRYVSNLAASETELWSLEFNSNQLFIHDLDTHELREGPYLIGDGPIDLVLLP